jgi:hypothetical protein
MNGRYRKKGRAMIVDEPLRLLDHQLRRVGLADPVLQTHLALPAAA